MKLVSNQIQYIEFTASDLPRIKEFYTTAFGWEFTDYGETYTAFTGEFVDGGFEQGEVKRGSILVVLYATDLEASRDKVVAAGGQLTKDIFTFPGGRRFQFSDPDGNELAVWTDK